MASAVITRTAEEIARSGQSDLGQVVRSIPQSFGGGQNPGIGSNVPSASGSDISGASSINLRGLGSDATLTLLNGHRLAYNAARQSVDVSAIPLGAVDRLEIVPDGASALYGSDAVAGVANILLKRDYHGLDVGTRLGWATDGGEFEQQYHATGGATWSGGGVIAAYEYGDSTGVLSDQRSYTRDQVGGLTLFPPLRHHSALISGHSAIGDHLTASIDVLFNSRKSRQESPENLAGDPTISRDIFASHDQSWGIAPSLDLELGGSWRASLAGTYGKERVDYSQTECLVDTCTQFATDFYRNTARSAEIDADGTLFELPGGKAKLAVGAGYRGIGFRRDGGTTPSLAVAHDQDSYFAYGELSLPLVGRAQQLGFLESASLSAALRYERYPGIGAVTTPKLGLIVAPTADVSIKGSWGRSFRAPTLFEQYQPRNVYVYPASPLGGPASPASAAVLLVLGGNAALRPERAETWSATLDLHPRAVPGLRMEVSYFHVRYRDRIVTPISFLNQALSDPIYAEQIARTPNVAEQAAVIAGASTFLDFTGAGYDPSSIVAIVDDSNLNAGQQSARGIDALVDYRRPIGAGQTITASANIAYLDSRQQLSASQPIRPLAGTLFNPPHWRGRASLSWDNGPLTITADVSRIGGVDDARTGDTIRVHGMTLTDLTIQYLVPGQRGTLSKVRLFVTAQNLFNAKPDQIATSVAYLPPYDSTNYSPLGRVLSVGVSKSW